MMHQSPLSQSFGKLYSLVAAEELPKKRKSVGAGGSPNKARRKNEMNSQTTSFYTHDGSSFDNRIFRCLVISPAGRAIRDFRSIP